MNICVFGDSIAWGAYDPEHGGWVTLLRNKLEGSDIGVICYNCGVCLATTKSTLERFDSEAAARNPHVIVFALGLNDSRYSDTPENPQVTKEKFTENVKKLIEEAKRFTDIILFIGLTPADETKIPFIENGKNIYYTNERIKEYDQLLEGVALEEKVHYLSMFDSITVDDLEDDVHPNTKGHQKMFEKVYAFLEENNLLK